MLLSSIPFCGLLLLINLQLFTTYPISPGLTESDMEILQVILTKLEDSVSQQSEGDRLPAERDDVDSIAEDAVGLRPQTGPREAVLRAFVSTKSLGNEAMQRSSGCFGRRMDRIGSMSSLGCNTVGKYNPK
ncbi:natriuretic peptides B [Antennarius striatus]|uniref:natriuretic peptides B n=1 Tax=Antennarius striatus TaxID=241820 RepID=UPI0035AF1CEA